MLRIFIHRDFISPHTLRVEAGLSHMMEQLVTNMKARRIMGESGKADGNRKPESLMQVTTPRSNKKK